MKTAILRLLAVVCFLTAVAPLRAADPSREYIIVAGGVSLRIWEKWKAAPHDGWWMNFIRASRIRIQQFQQELGPDLNITMLVYRPSYVTRSRQDSEDHLSKISSIRDAFGIKLVYFDSTSELINYINAGQPRDRVKIASLEYFGHSNKACWMFDYSNNIDSASKCWLHEKELGQIRRGIFTRDAFVKSWGCHTGESFSKKWRSATGVPMIGAVGKTQYMDEVLPILSTAGGRWTQ